MDYSQAYSEDVDRQWEDVMERAKDHLERVLVDLIEDLDKLGKATPYPNCTEAWYTQAYIRQLEKAQEIATFIGTGDAFGYNERFIGDFSYNGDY